MVKIPRSETGARSLPRVRWAVASDQTSMWNGLTSTALSHVGKGRDHEMIIKQAQDQAAADAAADAERVAQEGGDPLMALKDGDSVWGTTKADDAYNEARRMYFAVQKENQLAQTLTQLHQDNPNDIEAYQKAVRDHRKTFLESVPAEQIVALGAKYDAQATNLGAKVQAEQERVFHAGRLGEYTQTLETLESEITNAILHGDTMTGSGESLESATSRTHTILMNMFEQKLIGAKSLRSQELAIRTKMRRAEWRRSFRGLVEQNPEQAQDVIDAMKSGDASTMRDLGIDPNEFRGTPLDSDERIRLANTLETELTQGKASQTVAKGRVRSAMRDQLSSARNTGEFNPDIIDQAGTMFGPEVAEDFRQDISIAQAGHQAFKMVLNDPARTREIFDQLKPEPGGENYDARMSAYETARKQFETFQTMIDPFDKKFDPVGAIQSAYGTDDPDTILGIQEKWGLRTHQRSILTRGDAERRVDAIDQLEPGQRIAALNALRGEYQDDQFKLVYNDLVRAGMNPSTSILMNTQKFPQLNRAMSQALMIDRKDLNEEYKKRSEGGKSLRQLVEKVDQEMSAYKLTITGPLSQHNTNAFNSARYRSYQAYRDTLSHTALFLMNSGMSASDAVDATVGKFTSQWALEGSYRVPAQHNANHVRDTAETFLNDIGSLISDRDQADALRRSGYWMTNEDETGLILMTEFGMPAHGKDGRIEIKFEDAAKVGRKAERDDLNDVEDEVHDILLEKGIPH
ncbi:hypothetical protein V5T82_07290 [Magnetovibrio sp. PR-2]|uniref:hypothetical protein n=1 Tax=Magnetovibrio sp. PR-2 TaxID=3120356 RepID=UPI002FCE58A4